MLLEPSITSENARSRSGVTLVNPNWDSSWTRAKTPIDLTNKKREKKEQIISKTLELHK
jgi:hypothetical protein